MQRSKALRQNFNISPSGARDVKSWVQSIEENMSSLTAFDIENSQDINCIVDDKEIATRSVAFVVNSTRKGIVPLCTDVANLFKAKYSLERKVHELHRENEELRSSLSSSVASSLTNYSQQQEQQQESLGRLSSSRCSQCSSSWSSLLNSPQLTLPRLQQKCVNRATNTPSDFYKSKRIKDQPAVAERGSTADVNQESVQISMTTDKSEFSSDLKDKYLKSQAVNESLLDDLKSARSEIENLKSELKQLQTQTLEKTSAESFSTQSRFVANSSPVSTSSPSNMKSSSLTLLTSKSPNVGSTPSLLFERPLNKSMFVSSMNIRLTQKPTRRMSVDCLNLNEYSQVNHGILELRTKRESWTSNGQANIVTIDHGQSEDSSVSEFVLPPQYSYNLANGSKIQLGSHVRLADQRTGYVKYLGPLKGDLSGGIFAGIQLSSNDGDHVEDHPGVKNFDGPSKSGLLISVTEIETCLRDDISNISDPASITYSDCENNVSSTCLPSPCETMVAGHRTTNSTRCPGMITTTDHMPNARNHQFINEKEISL